MTGMPFSLFCMGLWRTCSIISCEAVAIYGVIMAIIMETKIASPKVSKDGTVDMSQFIWTGYSVLGAGLGVGLSNLACG